MSETVIGLLLLDAAAIANDKLAALPAEHPDRAFYTGKVFAAQYFARNVLPGVVAKAQLIAKDDRSAIDVPIAAFTS